MNEAAPPLVSIIMPAYNASLYIEEAINSVLRQSYKNWELIIVDDGSTDDTEQRCRQYHDNRIQYSKQSNGGVSSARNAGLKTMRGDFFCFLDADDILPPQSIEMRLNKFLKEPDIQFVDGVVFVFDKKLTAKVRAYKPRFKGQPFFELLVLNDSCFFGLSWMVRRKDITYRMREDISHGEDLLFYLALAREGGLYGYVNSEILWYRRHEEAAMNNLDKLNAGYRKIYSLLKEWPEFLIRYRIVYQYRIRRSMFLSYIRSKKIKKAFQALLS